MELYLTNITLLDTTKTSEVSSDVFVRVLVFNRQHQRRYSITSTAQAKAKQTDEKGCKILGVCYVIYNYLVQTHFLILRPKDRLFAKLLKSPLRIPETEPRAIFAKRFMIIWSLNHRHHTCLKLQAIWIDVQRTSWELGGNKLSWEYLKIHQVAQFWRN